MSETLSGLTPSEGWTAVHLFYRLDRPRWRSLSPDQRAAAIEEFRKWLSEAGKVEGLQLVPFAGITKCDFGVLAMHPDVWRVQQIIQEIAATAFGACLETVYSFLSLTESSEYITSETDWARMLIEDEKLDPTDSAFASRMTAMRNRTKAYSDSRIHPRLPDDYPLLCFYPMAKSRGEQNNWYTLDFETRKKLMVAHGNSGRRFATRITQLITTSTGIDDWEWGVTLFSKDLRAFRDIVYELRYDEASALYGLFGSFYIGVRFAADQLEAALKL